MAGNDIRAADVFPVANPYIVARNEVTEIGPRLLAWCATHGGDGERWAISLICGLRPICAVSELIGLRGIEEIVLNRPNAKGKKAIEVWAAAPSHRSATS
jgi:hypothetical protein